ncbi:hypothetical protein V1478_004434 [Vespula squamosa]|uniref:Uncharacterized protein n=1 Tax=Vespula squamosa TaxID=30214 RepID=A0ABD2BG64_VESSQ
MNERLLDDIIPQYVYNSNRFSGLSPLIIHSHSCFIIDYLEYSQIVMYIQNQSLRILITNKCNTFTNIHIPETYPEIDK